MQEFLSKLTEWEALVLTYLPVITSVLSTILVVIKSINISKDTQGKVVNSLNASTKEIRVVKSENVKLKTQIQEMNRQLALTNEKLDKLLAQNDKVVK